MVVLTRNKVVFEEKVFLIVSEISPTKVSKAYINTLIIASFDKQSTCSIARTHEIEREFLYQRTDRLAKTHFLGTCHMQFYFISSTFSIASFDKLSMCSVKLCVISVYVITDIIGMLCKRCVASAL